MTVDRLVRKQSIYRTLLSYNNPYLYRDKVMERYIGVSLHSTSAHNTNPREKYRVAEGYYHQSSVQMLTLATDW